MFSKEGEVFRLPEMAKPAVPKEQPIERPHPLIPNPVPERQPVPTPVPTIVPKEPVSPIPQRTPAPVH